MFFCSGKSVTTNLVPFTQYVAKNMDKRKQVHVLYTNFTKAFDRVNHYILIPKLGKYGIHASLLRWIESYISNRSQIVVLGGCFSKEIDVTSEVPQGSHLGPLLFIVYINTISNCFINNKFLLYSDDLNLFKPIDNFKDYLRLQSDLDEL